jgi:predicted dehydrogenase
LKLRVGIVGIGTAWNTRHRAALLALGDRFEVRAVCDPVAHRAEQIAAEFRARPVDSFRSIAFSDDIDAVMLLSARWFGALPILAACDAGKAVYCAASLELQAEEARSLRDRVRQAGIAFMAEFPCRLAPATLRLQELIATQLGKPRLMFCNQRHFASREEGLPQAINTRQLVEMVDWCRYIFGREATSVVSTAHSSREDGAGDDYLIMMLDFSDSGQVGAGPTAQIACGSYVPNQWKEATSFRRPADLQVVCERGIAFIDLPNTLVWFDRAGQHTEPLDNDRPVGEQLLMHFHRAVASLVLRTSSLDDAYRAMSVVLAAQRSYTENRRVNCLINGEDEAKSSEISPR